MNVVMETSKKGTKNERAILALIQSSTMHKAAEAAEVHVTTLWRWMKDTDFTKALREARRESFSLAIGRLQQSASAAAAVLQHMMVDKGEPGLNRLKAAVAVIELGLKAWDRDDLSARLTEVEMLVAKPTTKD